MVGKMIQKGRCVVVLSGGLDSTTVAYWAKNEGYDVHGLTFKYGQIATKETQHANIVAQKLGIQIKEIDLSSLKEIFVGVASIIDETIEITSTFSQSIIVPFRNGIFLSVAVAYAISINATKIFYGAQGSDAPNYPDCRTQFYKSFETAARIGTDTEIDIEAPFSNITKAELIKLGSKLAVPYALTWSCYLNKEKHCGKCESCINRKDAFKTVEIHDPTEYNK
jgi:7-cyano-7-deazaguanine synthase